MPKATDSRVTIFPVIMQINKGERLDDDNV